MVSSYKPKSIERIGFRDLDYDFFRNVSKHLSWNPTEEKIFIKDEFYPNGSLKSSTYYFGNDYIVLQNSSGTYNRTNIYQDGILVGYEDFDGKKRFVLPDHKGSAHLILNESGDVIEENLFSPFAEPLAGVKENKFSYEAKEFDSLTKDYNFNFRMFSPNGPPIFNQPDTLIQNVYDPQLLNRYAFERGNPYKNRDDDGHWVIPALIVIGAIVLTNAGGEILTQLSVTGGVYSWSKVGSAALEGLAVGVAVVGTAFIPVVGPYISAGLFTVYEYYSLYSTEKSIEQAQQNKIIEENSNNLKCTILPCPQNLPNQVPNQQTPASNPTQQANSAQTVSSNSLVTQNSVNNNPWISDYNNRYSRYSSSEPNKPVQVDNGKVTIGNGGSYGGFECYVESCSATEPYYKE